MNKILLCLLASVLLISYTRQGKTWVAIGDSITYLNDHLDETGNRVTKGYLTRVTEKMPYLTHVNQGHNGWTSAGIAREWDKLGIMPADVYTVFLGTNDWWQGRPIGTLDDYINNKGNSTIYGSFKIIADRLKALNSNATIILITPMQRADFVYLFDMKNNAFGSYREKNGQSLQQVAEAIKAIGEHEQWQVVDLYEASDLKLKNLVKYKRLKDANGQYKDFDYPNYIPVPFNPATDEYPYPPGAINLTYDGLHPSDKGNEMIARMLVKAFKTAGL